MRCPRLRFRQASVEGKTAPYELYLTAFTRLMQAHELGPADIDRVVVRANPFALTPIFCEQQPRDALTAEFSHPHALAVAAHHVPAGPEWYAPEVLFADEIRSFRAKVFVVPEPRSANIVEWMGGGQWRGVPGGVDIEARGTHYTATADYALGDPWSEETLMSDERLIEKFKVMVSGRRSGAGASEVDGDAVAHMIALLLDVDSCDSVRSAMDGLGRVAGSPGD